MRRGVGSESYEFMNFISCLPCLPSAMGLQLYDAGDEVSITRGRVDRVHCFSFLFSFVFSLTKQKTENRKEKDSGPDPDAALAFY